jgi:hypothetical protein
VSLSSLLFVLAELLPDELSVVAVLLPESASLCSEFEKVKRKQKRK